MWRAACCFAADADDVVAAAGARPSVGAAALDPSPLSASSPCHHRGGAHAHARATVVAAAGTHGAGGLRAALLHKKAAAAATGAASAVSAVSGGHTAARPLAAERAPAFQRP
jgi:hypothetical protein